MTGGGLSPAPLVGDDVKRLLTDDLRRAYQSTVDTWVVGDPQQVAADPPRPAAQQRLGFQRHGMGHKPRAGGEPALQVAQ